MKVKALPAATLILQLTLVHTCLGQRAPNLINYQGRLTDVTGTPLSQGTYTLELRLWDSSSNGSLIWGEAHTNVTLLSNGAFGVILGSGSPLITGPTPRVNDLSFAFTDPNRYLGGTVTASNGTQVVGASEIIPRQSLFSVPFALVSADGNAPGTISIFAGETSPSGWLPCEGQAISSVVYPALFAAIGTNWGAGGATNDFNLPDLRGVFLRGWNHGQGADPDASSRDGGDRVGSYQTDAFASHTHIVSDPGHTHNIYAVYTLTGIDGSFSEPEIVGSAAAGTYFSSSAQCNIAISPAGSSSESRPKNVCVMYVIKY